MIPILFEGTATDFSTNGIGRLSDAISCKVIEEKNGMYELSMQYPISGKLYSEIQNERIIVAVPFEGGSRQAFVIYEIDPNSNGTCLVHAQHISYRANYIPVLPFSVTGIQNAITALNTGIVPDTTGSRLPVPSPFTITTDIENTTSRYQQEIPRSLRACLGGDEGSLLDTFATKGTGEYEWDNFNIKFHFHRGSDKGYSIRYAKNLVSLDRQLDSSDLITGVLPYWDGLYAEESTDTVYYGDVQYSDNASSYPFNKIIPVDFSSDFDSAPTKDQLNAAGKSYVNQMAYLKDSIDLEFYDVNNQAVHLCDTIHVHYTQLGVTISQKVIKTTWNVLLDRYDTITVGTDVSNLGKTLQDSMAETKQYTNNKMVTVNQRIDYEVGVIQSSISSVEGKISKNMLESVITVYLRNDGDTPDKGDEKWDTTYPPAGEGTTIWSMNVYIYKNRLKVFGEPTNITEKGITDVHMQYLAGTDTTPEEDDPNWSDIMPAISENTVLWIRYHYTYSNNTSHNSTPTKALNSLFEGINSVNSDVTDLSSTVSSNKTETDAAITDLNSDISDLDTTLNNKIDGVESSLSGEILEAKSAADGALKSATVYYKKAADEPSVPTSKPETEGGDISGWSTTYPSQGFGDKIWTTTLFVYNNGTFTYSKVVEITEQDVVSVATKYLLTETNTTPSKEDSAGWSDTIPMPDKDKPYLWTMLVYTKSNNSTYKGEPTLGMSNLHQAVGGTLVKVETLYVAVEGTAKPGDAANWSTNYPSSSDSKGKHVWQRLRYIFADGHVTMSEVTEVTESGVESVTTLYYLSADGVNPPAYDPNNPTGWTNYVPEVTKGYYLWSMELYTLHNGSKTHSDPILAMNNFYQKVVNNDTRITQTENEIGAQATRITTISQSIGVNLTPFFSHDFKDVKGSDDATEGYWQRTMPTSLTKDVFGWAVYDGSIADSYFAPVDDPEIDFDKVTILVEIDNLALAGTAYPYIRFQNGSNNQHYQASSNFSITQNGAFLLGLTKSTIENPARLLQGRIHRGTAGDSFDIRLSLYKETYTGDYVPYVTPADSINDYIAGVRNAQIQSNALLQIQNSAINSIVEQVNTINDNYVTEIEAGVIASTKVTEYKTEVDQSISALNVGISQNSTVIDELGKRYDAEIAAHFAFTADGLDIRQSNRSFTGHFDADSLDFIDTNGETFGWIGAEEGVGGNLISIGEAGTNNRRWVIYPSSDGSTLRFSRVNRG